MKRTILLSAAACALSMLAGCNTVAGLGQDLQAGGEAISEAADEVAGAFTGSRSEYASTASGETCDPGGRELKGRSSRPPCR